MFENIPLICFVYKGGVCNYISLDVTDQANFMVTPSQQTERCVSNKNIWLTLEKDASVHAAKTVMTCPTVVDVLKVMESQAGKQDILVTGSLHLIGSVLSVLDPNLSISTNTASYKNITAHSNSSSSIL